MELLNIKGEEMKQIDTKYICKYCIGCNAEESDNFLPRYNCKNFVPGYENWAELRRKELKNSWKSKH